MRKLAVDSREAAEVIISAASCLAEDSIEAALEEASD